MNKIKKCWGIKAFEYYYEYNRKTNKKNRLQLNQRKQKIHFIKYKDKKLYENSFKLHEHLHYYNYLFTTKSVNLCRQTNNSVSFKKNPNFNFFQSKLQKC